MDHAFIHFLQVNLFKYALSRPGALTATINYYRCLPYSSNKKLPTSKVQAPTLLIWVSRLVFSFALKVSLFVFRSQGEQDAFLSKDLNKNLGRWVPNLTEHYITEASHWVNQVCISV